MESLLHLVRGYLESADFRILLQDAECLVADKLMFGQERDTWIVWTVPPGVDAAIYEPTLRSSISKIRPNYPDAKLYVLAESRGGFSRDLLQDFAESRIKFLVPIWFFDTPFKFEEAPKAISTIADIRSRATAEKRVPQPYRTGDTAGRTDGDDLFETLRQDLVKSESACVRLVVGRAGIGKSFLHRALFAHLYNDFLTAKARHGQRPRPIPFLPEHLKGTLRTEALIDNLLRTDVASPVDRKTFEWLLVNGFTIWLLDGLDELYAGDPDFFEYVSDLLTRKNSRAQVTIWCRDSVLTTSDEFAEFQELCGSQSPLKIYRLSEWAGTSKRHFAWLRLENRAPKQGEQDTGRVTSFLHEINSTPVLRSLSGLPLHCDLLLQQYQEGHLRDFGDEVALLNHVVDRMVQREVEKGLLDLRLFEPDGLQEWLEQIAVDYVEGQKYADINRDQVREYGQIVLREGLDDATRQHILTSLLQFPLFRAGTVTGAISFAHDLIAEALAARRYLRMLCKQPEDVAHRLSHIDLEDPILLRFMASRLGPEDEVRVADELQRGSFRGRGCAVFLSLLMLARPERDLVKRVRPNLEGQDLTAVCFVRRDLSGMSFRGANLSRAAFQGCDLHGAQFEGAFLSYTGFRGDNELEGARFGDLGRVQSVLVRGKLLDDPLELRQWIAQSTGCPEPQREPCPTALQLVHLFRKFITPLGEARRDNLNRDGLVAGKRYPGAAPTEACIEAAVHHGYLVGPDYRNRFRRAGGDKYAEMVEFVRDSAVSDGIGRLLADVCPRRGCMHQLRS
jgi:hypothetical protein